MPPKEMSTLVQRVEALLVKLPPMVKEQPAAVGWAMDGAAGIKKGGSVVEGGDSLRLPVLTGEAANDPSRRGGAAASRLLSATSNRASSADGVRTASSRALEPNRCR